MTWYAVHRSDNGELVSVGTEVADPLPVELTALALTGEPSFRTHRWNAATRAVEPIPPPTDDELIAQQPRKQRLEPTVAAGKAALRDLLDEQVQEAQAWEWFSTKAAADTNLPAAAKTAVAALATAEYERAKRLLAAWRAAT